MNLNLIIDPTEWALENIKEINSRAKLDVGKFCTHRCFFCYYKNDLDSKDYLTPKNAGLLVKYLLANGMTEIELSGGEPTSNPHIIDILKTIENEFKEANLPPKISMVSNGDFNEETRHKLTPYVKEWLFSFHGIEHVHTYITGTKSKSFQNLFDNINFLRKIGHLVRVNFVVCNYQNRLGITKSNLDIFSEILLGRLLADGIQINLLPLNFWKDAKNLQTDDKLIYSSINNFIGGLKKNHRLKGVEFEKLINIRYPQFCLLSDEARNFARGHFDHISDMSDWNKVYYPYDTDPEDKVLSTEPIRPQDIYTNFSNTLENNIKRAWSDRIQSHFKDVNCKSCKYFFQCDGVKITDPSTDGFKEYRKWFTSKKPETTAITLFKKELLLKEKNVN